MRLNIEQRKLITSKPNGPILIKGVAGSGKTTVAVHKIPQLLNHYCYEQKDMVLMVTYNKTLIKYIEHLYSKVDSEEQLTFESLISNNEHKLDIYTIDKLLYDYFNLFKKKNNFKYNVTYNNYIKETMSEAIALMQKKYPSVKMLDHKNLSFIMDEINWIKSCNYMELDVYQNIDRIGRMSSTNEGPQRLIKNSDARQIIFETMIMYDSILMKKGYVDAKTAAIIALKEAENNPIKKYTHIIIDESQDLTRVQIEMLKLLYQEKIYSSFSFIADTAQSIYPNAWLVKGRSFTSIGFNMTGKSNSLTKNYRTTTQISEAAYSLLEKDTSLMDDENFVKPSLIDRKGEYPVYRRFINEEIEARFIATEINNLLLMGYYLHEIAIIAKTQNQINSMQRLLNNNKINAAVVDKRNPDFEANNVKLLTIHSIKGLEFKVVFICGLNENIIPLIPMGEYQDAEHFEACDRKLLYVGMTRANELLYMSSNGRPSKFISQIDPKYLKCRLQSKLRIFHSLQINQYRYTNQIIDIYSKEEKVRQWVLSELINIYQYPESLIDIEYKIQNFSRSGFVDVVVYIYKDNEKIPYIFVETKAYGKGINDAIEQLKSYMNVNKYCQYGLATDGNEICIIDKNFDEIDEIPSFQTSMLPSNIETFVYNDIRHQKKYSFIKEDGEISSLTFVNKDDNMEYTVDDLKQINVYGEIVAGQPKYAQEEIGDKFYLPEEWLPSGKQCFLLKVVGDSMVGAGINYGDYVLIESQTVANNMDYVVATIDDSATLKKFMKMGDSILLIPENPNYEPIQMNCADVYINGVVRGVLKIKQ